MNDPAGALLLRPGQAVPGSLRSTRRAWAERLAPGRVADTLPELLASLFSLCGQAHRVACRLALHAADPEGFAPVTTAAGTLQLETAREHVRRVALDWPRHLLEPGAAPQALESLRLCPLLTPPLSPPLSPPRSPPRSSPDPAPPWAATRAWLQTHWLHMPAHTWWRAWQAQGPAWVLAWARTHSGWLPALLCSARRADTPLPQARSTALAVRGQDDMLRTLGRQLAREDGFALQPRWQGQVVWTGPWARLAPQGGSPTLGAWDILVSRLAELVQLCLQDEAQVAPWPHGALQTGEHQGLAWVEMARGLLIHQVSLEPTSASHEPRVHACQVLAPTEWNFHPEGIVAQALSALPRNGPELKLRTALLMSAFDPCVAYALAPSLEDAHA